MAKRFLERLPRIPENELPKDSFCMICHREYGSDPVDGPVRLPCSHHVGFECISIWLSPDRDFKNTCPMCRFVFFDAISEEEEEQYHRQVILRVGRYPSEGSLVNTSEEEDPWYSYFLEAAAEQYEESLRRARAYLASAFPTAEEYHVTALATAYRTLAIREMMLYLKWSREGADLPPLPGVESRPLTAEELEALFRELQRRGAFAEDLHLPHYHDLTDREKWLLHREEGESYCPFDNGYWSVLLA